MNNTTIDIGWIELITGHSLVAIPILIFLYYKVNLIKDTIIAVIRMAVQLIFIGFYLEYIFKWNNLWINSLWILIMVIVTTFTISDSTKLKLKYFAIPNFIAVLISLVTIDMFLLGYIIKTEYLFDAQYIIPISGMILGNSLQNNIIALTSFYNDIRKNELQYRYSLSMGSNLSQATAPFMRDAISKAFSPTIARMAVIGLIALPGTMTGQIIGGSSPMIAIKYQIMLMLMIFISSVMSVFISILIANNFAFDKYLNLRLEIFSPKAFKEKNKSKK